MGKPTPEELLAIAKLESHILPSRRLELEQEFHKWAKDTGARVDVFNVIGWLQEKGLMLSDDDRQSLVAIRNEFRLMGWPRYAARIDAVLKED